MTARGPDAPGAVAGGVRPGIGVAVVEGAPGEVLAARWRTARLLVVGSQDRSRLEGVALGSVAQHCVLVASCPTMVVHPERPGRFPSARPSVGALSAPG